MPPDLTDVKVIVPRIRRAVEGPAGPIPGIPALTDTQALDLAADAMADAILYSGGLFGHKLIVTTRDPDAGFPTGWKTDAVLDEWEVSVVTAQAAISYFFHLFRDQKTSETITNEGQSWDWERNGALIRDQLKFLIASRDEAMKQLRVMHPVVDRYASVLAIRDAQTVAVLEWYTRYNPDNIGVGGVGGGLEQMAGIGGMQWTPG